MSDIKNIKKALVLYEKEKKIKKELNEAKKNSYYNEFPFLKENLTKLNLLGIKACEKEISLASYEKEVLALLNERDAFIKKNKLDKSVFKEHLCPKCLDTGLINSKACSCLAPFLEKINEMKASQNILFNKYNFDNFDLSIFNSDENKGKKSPKDNMEENLLYARKFIDDFSKDSEQIGLLFTGSVATGKSFLAYACGNEIAKEGFDVICLNAFDLENLLRAFKEEDYNKKLQSIFNCDLLVIDDLGVESQSDFINNNLLKLLSYRIDYSKKIIITTNLTTNELRDMYKDRIFSRIIGNFKGLRFYGDDLRLTKKLR